MTDERVPVALTDATVRRLFDDPEFGVAKRGYDVEQVAGFLDTLGGRMVTLLGRLGNAEKEAKAAHGQIEDFRTRAEQAEASRDLFERTLLLAEETASASVADAKVRADRIEADAQADSRRMVDETRLRIERMMDAARVDVQQAYADERLALTQAQDRIAGESDQLETLRLAVAAETMALEEVRNELRRRIRRAATDLLGVAESADCLGQPVTRGIPEVVAQQTEHRLEQETSVPDDPAMSPAEPPASDAAVPQLPAAPVDLSPVPPPPAPTPTASAPSAPAPTAPAPPVPEPQAAAPRSELPPPEVPEGGRFVVNGDPTVPIDLSETAEPAAAGETAEPSATVPADAFDRFMSQEIEEEPSRSWILA